MNSRLKSLHPANAINATIDASQTTIFTGKQAVIPVVGAMLRIYTGTESCKKSN
jgi:hypothetical protein